ncbi:transglycosylase SLT domain-containing protein [Flammeovirga yaeyamensis]|uniref:Transglycosylase SLT domain-containing protein n=1 Tax=Flammeovirga yaeyamensis TaxID=367791 RepID=A0AAX1N5V3_9BACT|nr:transglycosylase SLT domain-containing protein [Flammeovirga yaeyamensis]MBB3698410.1 membrane-bound lytic murein transglycosylase D [Flammeovirga yaeyamensis]NMF34239.1 transglycosylase SLT domain-containing protein [Flammeovirga yaeyamensis]QWG01223.1 transglycosylase SLT domain-containing protein [Flammeovirga yaeyamensis]
MNSRIISILLLFFPLLSFASLENINAPIPSQFELMGSKVVITNGGMQKVMVKYNSLTRSEKHYNELLERCNSYFPYIERELLARGVPGEFKYLALQESLLDGNAISNAKPPAVGFWQFKDFTAEERGMKINRSLDERKNVVSASIGAADYLSKNYYYLGNWFYAMISYHDGLGGARSYIRNHKLNYYNHVTINENTHPYLIHYLAHYFAFKDKVGLDDGHFVMIEFPTNGYTLKEVSKFTGQSLDILAKNNTWLYGSYIPEDKVYSVMIESKPDEINQIVASLSPYAKPRKTRARKDIFKFYADSIQENYPFVLPIEKGVQGEKFELALVNGVKAVILHEDMTQKELSEAVGISKGKIRKYNYEGKDDVLIKDSHYYIAPLPLTIPESYHIMKDNETLTFIAVKYGISLKALKKLNDVRKEEDVKTGDKIYFN